MRNIHVREAGSEINFYHCPYGKIALMLNISKTVRDTMLTNCLMIMSRLMLSDYYHTGTLIKMLLCIGIILGINTILPGNLLSIETYILISENWLHWLHCVLRVCGAVCTMRTLGGLSLLTTAYLRILRTYVWISMCICICVYFIYIFISCIMYSVTQMHLTFV